MAKSGPKKQRAKSEADKIAAAVAENTVKPKRASRRVGRVRTYSYKKPTNKAVRDHRSRQELANQMRAPQGPSDYERFAESLSEDERPFARKLWQMSCEHEDEALTIQPNLFGYEVRHWRCNRCGVVRQAAGNATATKRIEWLSYCPDGFDQWEWEDLYTRDRSMWRYIFNEVHFLMVDESLTKED